MGNTTSSTNNTAVVFVAYTTGNDNTGRVYLYGSKPRNSSESGVFKTVNAASEALQKGGYDTNTTNSIHILLYADLENRPCNRLKRNFYYMSNSIIGSDKRVHISTVDGVIKYLNPKDNCGNLFTPNSFLYIDYRFVIDNAHFNFINFTASGNRYIMSDTINANGKFVRLNSGDTIHGRPNINANYKFVEDNHEDIIHGGPTMYTGTNTNTNTNTNTGGTPMIKSLKTNIFNNFVIEFSMKDYEYQAKIIIQNNGHLLGEFPSFICTDTNVNTSNVNDHIIAIENMGESTINFDNNNVLLNTSIISEIPLTLIKTSNPTPQTKINLENCELDLSIPASVLFSNLTADISSDLFNFIRCNFKQTNQEFSLISNTTNYRMVDGISKNVLLPTCSNMISDFTSNYNTECTQVRPDVSSKINGGTLANSTIIIPPKVIKTDTQIENIFLNDASIYLIDASDGDIEIILPSKVLDGLYLTFKKIDKTSNWVTIIAPNEFSIDGHRKLILKTRKCYNIAKKLLYHNNVYYVL